MFPGLSVRREKARLVSPLRGKGMRVLLEVALRGLQESVRGEGQFESRGYEGEGRKKEREKRERREGRTERTGFDETLVWVDESESGAVRCLCYGEERSGSEGEEGKGEFHGGC
jgi:hypothetical protein